MVDRPHVQIFRPNHRSVPSASVTLQQNSSERRLPYTLSAIRIPRRHRHQSLKRRHGHLLSSNVKLTNVIRTSNNTHPSAVSSVLNSDDHLHSSGPIIWESANLNKSKQQQNGYSARTKEELNSDREHSFRIFFADKDWSNTKVKHADNQSIFNNSSIRTDNHHDVKMMNMRLDLTNAINQRHQNSKRKRNKKSCGGYHYCSCCSPLCLMLSLFAILLVATAIAAALVKVLTSQTSTTTTTISTTTTMACASAGIVTPRISTCATWNQTGITVAGSHNRSTGTDLGSFNSPIDIFVDSNYTLFVVDGNNNRIMKYYANAVIGILAAGDLTAGSNSNQLSLPKGIAIDQTGALIVGDTANYRIQKFSCGSTVATTVSVNSSASLLGMTRDVHADANNNIYVTDSTYHRVVMFYSNSSIGVIIAGNNGAGSAANQLLNPFGSFIDDNQTLYVADAGNQRVQMWSVGATSGVTVAGSTGSAGSSLTQLSNPYSVVVDNNGYIYIVDGGNSRIMRWTTNYAAGGVCIAGCSGTSGLNAHQLYGPRDLKFDPSGNLYVSDQGNQRIQKFMIESSTSNCSISK